MGRMRLIKIEELSQRTKDAAMYLIAHRGLMDLSINSISRQSGINENHIYRHFGTKDEILFQCYKEVTDEIISRLDYSRKNTLWTDRGESKIEVFWSRYIEALIDLDYKALFWQEYRTSKALLAKLKDPRWQKKYIALNTKLDIVLNSYFRLSKYQKYRFVKTLAVTQADIVARQIIENDNTLDDGADSEERKKYGLDLLLFGVTHGTK